MKCAGCGYEKVPAAARFCPKCGKELPRRVQPVAKIKASVRAGSVEGGAVTGVRVDQVTGDASIESTINLMQKLLVQGNYVKRQEITNNILLVGPGALDEIAKRLAALQGVDRKTLGRQGVEAPPEHVSRQIDEVVAAQRESAAEGVPTSPQAAYNLGMLAAYQRDYEAALDYFRQATQADPEHVAAFEAIAWLQQSRATDDLRSEDYDAAVEKLAEARTAALHTDPTDARALAMRGYISKTLAQLAERRLKPAERDKYYAEAARLFEHAAKEDPNDPAAHNGLGNVQHAMGNLDAAIAAYRRAIQLAPSYTAAWHDLAYACDSKMEADSAHAKKWCQEALTAWREAYRLAPNDPGFSAEYVVSIGQRISWLEGQCGKRNRG